MVHLYSSRRVQDYTVHFLVKVTRPFPYVTLRVPHAAIAVRMPTQAFYERKVIAINQRAFALG